MKEQELRSLRETLTAGMTLDQPDVDLFSLKLEKTWKTKMAVSCDLFYDMPRMLARELKVLKEGLLQFQIWFEESEEYERAAVCRDLLYELFKHGLNQKSCTCL